MNKSLRKDGGFSSSDYITDVSNSTQTFKPKRIAENTLQCIKGFCSPGVMVSDKILAGIEGDANNGALDILCAEGWEIG